MGRLNEINRALKSYDSELFAVSNKPPRIDVYRQNRDKLSPPHFIFSLTEDWTVKSTPIEWGIEPILARLRAIDLWNSGLGVEDFIQEAEKSSESKKRHLMNTVEGFLYDFRSEFAKATNGINTSTLEKIDKRKENSHGYRQSRIR